MHACIGHTLHEARASPVPGGPGARAVMNRPVPAQEVAARPQFADLPERPALRRAITAATRRPEPDCVRALLDLAALEPAASERAQEQARALVRALRDKARARARRGGVEGLIQEYSLSSQEGVALMCLAEALLRIPDAATRDALIRDKIAAGDWRAHLGHSPSPFVNAATWGLLVTGRLVATSSEAGLTHALTRLIARGGEPLIRRGVDLAMRLMGEQFVTGQTIEEALARSRRMEAKGFSYSYDMLGEAATTAEDAARYLADYEGAILAIGRAAGGRALHDGPGISIKLSALHPRYARAKAERVMGELLPRVAHLCRLARGCGIGLNIDAEEADRLELSLDILEALSLDPDVADWDGLGFVIQAYGRRCPFVIDWLIDLARRSGRRLMVRLVKGAYWDSEIKRAQVDGMADFPSSRARSTPTSRTSPAPASCSRRPTRCIRNSPPTTPRRSRRSPRWPGRISAPATTSSSACTAWASRSTRRWWAPVSSGGRAGSTPRSAPHETLLAYLVRRLLENGANSSFVNRIADEAVPVDDLVADPVAVVRAAQPPGAPHPKIAAPRDVLGPSRPNSRGLDLASEADLARLTDGIARAGARRWEAAPAGGGSAPEPVLNPADHRDVVGTVRHAAAGVTAAVGRAVAAAPAWAATAPEARAVALARAADAMEAAMPELIGLIAREAGKSAANAVAEVREAVDFLRYYGAEAVRTLADGAPAPLGPVVCISPWNFPLAIFTGQVAAALAAGNPVLAKPAEETPLVAAEAVRLLHAAGVPADALQFLPGAGETGAALVADPRIEGVMFTGSTAVARLIQRRLAGRLGAGGQPVPLVAETGGQNAMVVDSSALAEQVVGDVIASAFDSAGQRCSALRILCLQDDVAERILAMLRGAMRELEIGDRVAFAPMSARSSARRPATASWLTSRRCAPGATPSRNCRCRRAPATAPSSPRP